MLWSDLVVSVSTALWASRDSFCLCCHHGSNNNNNNTADERCTEYEAANVYHPIKGLRGFSYRILSDRSSPLGNLRSVLDAVLWVKQASEGGALINCF